MALRSLCLLLLCVSTIFAQSLAETLAKAPPEIDEALRARITAFYQAHVDGKFRLADQYVAEDSKDAYFEADKERIVSFMISQIRYSEDYRQATALVLCERRVVFPGFAGVVKVPIPSLWKVANGDWYWYVMPKEEGRRESPFGLMGSVSSQEGKGAALPAALPSMEAILNQVNADRTAVRMVATVAGREAVRITNQSPGEVTLHLDHPSLPGLRVELEKTTLAANETCEVTITWSPRPQVPRDPVPVRIMVHPLGSLITIHVGFVLSQ
ncbi:MAG: hypothetical protein ACK5AZ_04630 [Bryobacteraceae bacterium]